MLINVILIFRQVKIQWVINKVFRRFLTVFILLAYCMFSGKMFHSAAEEVANKLLPYLIVQFLLCISVVVEKRVKTHLYLKYFVN